MTETLRRARELAQSMEKQEKAPRPIDRYQTCDHSTCTEPARVGHTMCAGHAPYEPVLMTTYHVCFRVTATREVRTEAFVSMTERALFIIRCSAFIEVLEEWVS